MKCPCRNCNGTVKEPDKEKEESGFESCVECGCVIYKRNSATLQYINKLETKK